MKAGLSFHLPLKSDYFRIEIQGIAAEQFAYNKLKSDYFRIEINNII